MVGNVPIGGGAPISVQSMTNTDTRDVKSTLAQINSLKETGADLVRVSYRPGDEKLSGVSRNPLRLLACRTCCGTDKCQTAQIRV